MTNKPTEHDGQPIGVHAYECRKCGKGIEAMRADPVCRAAPQEPDDDAEWPSDALFERDAPVKKKGRASWRGSIVGWYRTELTGLGFNIESYFEPGSVQIYPQTALEAWQPPNPPYSGIVDEADFTRGEE